MKLYLRLLTLIAVGATLYTLYGLMTFQPDEATPFSFNEPKLPPELIAEDNIVLNADETERQKLAVQDAQRALDTYRSAAQSANTQIKDTVSLIADRTANWELPPYFLTTASPSAGAPHNFQILGLDMSNILDSSSGQTSLSCSVNTPFARTIVGTTSGDVMGCDKVRDITGQQNSSDVIFVGGPGNDTITDVTGNRVVNGGTGDDTITLGQGRSLIILEQSFGHDTVTVDCTGARVTEADLPKGFPIPWVYKTTNFIVLANGLDAKDMVWKENVLTNTVTADTLTVSDNCFTVVPVTP